MSHTLVLAAVTAVLKNLLENGLVDRGITAAIGSDTAISALPPDRIATGSDEKVQLNLFLYQVHSKGLSPTSPPRQAFGRVCRARPAAQPGDAVPDDRLRHGRPSNGNPARYGMELFQEMPLLNAEALGKLLKAVSSRSGGHLVSASRAALADPLLPQSFRRIKVCPQALQTEEMVNLWSAFQVSYRPSVAYHVSVELADDAVAEKGR